MSIFHNNFATNPTFSSFKSVYRMECPKGVTGPMPPKIPTDDIMNQWINNEPLMITKLQNYDSLSFSLLNQLFYFWNYKDKINN